MKKVLMAVAAVVVVVFGYQACSASDPETFGFEQSRDYASSFVSNHCKDIGCDHSQGAFGLFLDHYKTPEGWVWVFRTKGEPGETHVLFPARNPKSHRIVQRPTE